jgi:hypothetical protein
MIDYEDFAVDCLKEAPKSGNPEMMTARAQVYATLALVQAVQDLVIPLDGITERIEIVSNQLYMIRKQ